MVAHHRAAVLVAYLFVHAFTTATADSKVDAQIKQGLVLELKVPKKTVPVGFPLFMEVSMKARRPHRTYSDFVNLYRWKSGGIFVRHKGAEYQVESALDDNRRAEWDMARGPAILKVRDRVVQFGAVSFFRVVGGRVDKPGEPVFPSPGTYKIQVRYRNLVTSNTVEVVVTAASSPADRAIRALKGFPHVLSECLSDQVHQASFHAWYSKNEKVLRKHGPSSSYASLLRVCQLIGGIRAAINAGHDLTDLSPEGAGGRVLALVRKNLARTGNGDVLQAYTLFYGVALLRHSASDDPTVQRLRADYLKLLRTHHPKSYFLDILDENRLNLRTLLYRPGLRD